VERVRLVLGQELRPVRERSLALVPQQQLAD
jgi:hypothetical protein